MSSSFKMASATVTEKSPLNSFQRLYSKQKQNHLLAGEKRFNALIDQIDFGNTSLVHKLQILNGRTSL